jgi:DNA ligase 1
MRFDELSTCFEQLEAVTGRLEMYRLLGELFHRANPDETAEIAYLCEARLLPAFANLEMGMGERMAAASIAAATGKLPQKIDAIYQRFGDLGLVVEKLLPPKRSSNLSVSAVYAALLEIAHTNGAGSVEKKVSAARLVDHTHIAAESSLPRTFRCRPFASRDRRSDNH